MPNYLTPVLDFLDRQLPDCDRSLLRYYALLAFTHGVNTTLENVHDAWALWRDQTNPDHRSLIPFGELTPEVQQLDAPYMKAIHLAAMKVTGEHPEARCRRCGTPNSNDWCAPSPLWNQVMRGGDINGGPEPFGGFLCPTCFMVLAQEAGVASRWRLDAMQVHVPLQMVTPSGRVWNEQTWLFDEPSTNMPDLHAEVERLTAELENVRSIERTVQAELATKRARLGEVSA